MTPVLANSPAPTRPLPTPPGGHRPPVGALPSADRSDVPPALTSPHDLPALRSEDLLRGRRAVEIVHSGARYRLSVTALGKLILTK